MLQKISIWIILLSSYGFSEESSISLSKKHIIIADGFPQISYYFAINNKGSNSLLFNGPIINISGIKKVYPQEGLNSDNLKLNENGIIVLQKTFPPGKHILSVVIELPLTNFGDDIIKVYPASEELEELSIVVQKHSPIVMESLKMQPGVPAMLAKSNFKGIITKQKLSQGEPISINISNIPKIRPYLKVLAALFGIILTLTATILSWNTRQVLVS